MAVARTHNKSIAAMGLDEGIRPFFGVRVRLAAKQSPTTIRRDMN